MHTSRTGGATGKTIAMMANVNLPGYTLNAIRNGSMKLQAPGKSKTAENGEATAAMENRIRIFYKKFKIALNSHPQLREKLGLLER